MRWERRRTEGLHYEATATRGGPDYRPDLGFVTRRNFTELNGEVAYGWFPDGEARFRRVTPEVDGTVALRNGDGSVQSAEVTHEWEMAYDSGREVEIGAQVRLEDLRDPLSFPEETVVPDGRYTFPAVTLEHQPPDGGLLRIDANTSIGGFFDGWRWRVGASLTWNPSRHLELGGTCQANVVRFPDRDQRFVAHVAQARVRLAANKQLSTNAFLQYNSAADLATANVRFRCNFGQANDLWIVYNEGINLDRGQTVPRVPRTEARSVLLKYTYTFQM